MAGEPQASGQEARVGTTAPEGLRVLKLCYEFPPLGGGGARVVDGLMRELGRRGHAADLITMGRRGLPRVDEVARGCFVHRVPCLRRKPFACSVPEAATYLLPAYRKARRLLRRHRYDLIHAHFIFPDGLLAWRLARLHGIRYVITAHGSDVPGYNPHRLKLLHRVLAPVWRRVVRGAERILCPSEHVRSLVHARLPDAPVEIVPNGMSLDRLRADGCRQRRILAVTRMLERKGVQHLLRAFASLPPGHELHVVGDGPDLPRVRAMPEASAPGVRIHGWLDNSDPLLNELYESSEIFVLFSEAENFPVVLLEAMAAGLAIVTTSGTGCADVVGPAGVLVPPRDEGGLRRALGELMVDPERCRALGIAARRRLEDRFSWEAVGEQTIRAYRAHAPAPAVRASR